MSKEYDSFDEWLAAFQTIAEEEFGLPVTELAASDWEIYYAAGMTPKEAIYAEMESF